VQPPAVGPVLDEQARSACRSRLAALAGEPEAADRAGNARRGGRLEAERQALPAELRRATGQGGRIRHVGPDAERARVNVTPTHSARHTRADQPGRSPRRGAPAGVDPHRTGPPL